MPDYQRPPALRFNFKGMNTVLPPDALAEGKYPLAINARAYLRDSLTPRLPQSINLLPSPLGGLINSLRRMDDTTPSAIILSTTGPNPAGTGASVPFLGTLPWSNPGNITVQDGAFASVTTTSPAHAVSEYLQGSNFLFAIPGGATIYGILVEIKGFQSVGTGIITVQLFKTTGLGGFVGSPKITNLPGANAFISLGGSLDTWGAAWVPADINSAGFGVSIQATDNNLDTFNVDFVRVTVFIATPSGPAAGFVFISGTAYPDNKVYVNSTVVHTGTSGNRLAMVPFRPNTSVAPWMYIGDSLRMIKVRSDSLRYLMGIAEPQTIPTVSAAGGVGPISGSIFYAYVWRSSKTGALSNPSPTAHSQAFVAVNNNVLVVCLAGSDPQIDLIDVYRFGNGLLNYTYITTLNNAAPSFVDTLSDAAVANNPQLAFDNYQPFPTIDIPKTGTVTISAGALAGTVNLLRVSGDSFNTNWLGGTIIFVSQAGGASQASSLIMFNRPSDSSHMIGQIQPVGSALAPGNYTYVINQPIRAEQPLPALWGPTDNAAFMFACGDPLRPGTLYFTKGNNPDSAPQTNSIELTSPAEPLIGGCIVGGLGLAMSAERGWLIYPNFAQATATVVGVIGSPFTTVESIADRGLYTKEGICTDGGGNAYFISKDSIRKSPGGVGSAPITDEDLYNLFPHEGQPQQIYMIAGQIIYPPDYSQPDGMALRFSQGYVYFNYIGLDNGRHTLVYDTVNEAWNVDVYAAPAAIHADNTGNFISPGPAVPIGPIMGCVEGTIRQLSPTAVEPGIQMTVLTPAYDAGEQRATKHYGDLYLETTTPGGVIGNFALTLFTDRYSVLQVGVLNPATIPAVAGVRVGSVLELNAGSGVYGRDIELIISLPVNAVGSILHLWQPASVVQPETTGERFTDWYDGGNNGAKFIQGAIVEADTASFIKQFQAQSADDLSFNNFVEVGGGIAFIGRSKKAFSIAVPFVAHSVRLAAQDTVPWRVWGVEWIWVPYPELAREWHTEGVSHGLKGFQHIGEINVPHISTADLTLTLVPDIGAPVPVIVPNSAGKQTKTLVTIPAFKFKIVAYNFTSAAAFRLWKEDVEVKVKAWGDSGPYQIVRPFGGESAAQAEV